jgi:hypothetical protein
VRACVVCVCVCVCVSCRWSCRVVGRVVCVVCVVCVCVMCRVSCVCLGTGEGESAGSVQLGGLGGRVKNRRGSGA